MRTETWRHFDFLLLGAVALLTIFGIADFTVANILNTINALLIALFAGWVLNRRAVDEEFAGDSPLWKSYWRIANRYLAPVVLIVVFVNLVFGWDRILQAL